MANNQNRLSGGLFRVEQSHFLENGSTLSGKDAIREDYGRKRDMSKVTIFPAKKQASLFDPNRRMNVVVYCRVSTDGISQTTSFELQKNYYLSYVRKHNQWKLIAVYSDEGITATSMDKRIGLQTMLADVRSGKIDIIVVKNLSRLSRNLMDCMQIIYTLRSLPHPVGIFFESENLYTLDKSADFTLQVLSLVAQEESHKKSEAMLASYFMRFSQGQYVVPDLLGFNKAGRNKLSVNEKEAQTVQLIFMMYLAGYSCATIAGVLTNLKRKTHVHVKPDGTQFGGKTEWTADMVFNVLKNERRCGDVLAQKTWTPNYLDHKSKVNNGSLPQFFAKDQHAAIVSPTDYFLTQRLLAANCGGWKNGPQVMEVISSGWLKGFVRTAPNWRGFSAEDYNRGSLRGYGVTEEELDNIYQRTHATEDERAGGKENGIPLTEDGAYQYRYAIDSDDYALYPDGEGEKDASDDAEEQISFKIAVDEYREYLRGAGKTVNESTLEVLRSEMFSVSEKMIMTMDRNGLFFNRKCYLSFGVNATDEIELAYNPVRQCIVLMQGQSENLKLKWAREKDGKMEMRRCLGRGLMRSIFENMHWNLNYKYRVIGTLVERDNQKYLVFDISSPITCVSLHIKGAKETETKTSGRKKNIDLIKAGYLPEEIQVPDFSTQEIENKEADKNSPRSRAIYFDGFSTEGGVIHVESLGNNKYQPEYIQAIMLEGRKPEEGWIYLKGMAKITRHGFSIYPKEWVNTLGSGFSDFSWMKISEAEHTIPYGWTVDLDLPTKDTVNEAISVLYQQMLEEEMVE